MGQIFKYGMVAAALAAAGLAAAEPGIDTLPTPQFFIEIVGPDTAGTTAQVAISQPEAMSVRPATTKPARSSISRRYGPVAADDTLWSIAKGISANQPVSIYQTCLALFQHNPMSFKDGKISLLLDGSYLDVPSLKDIRAIDPETAAARFAALQRGDAPSAKTPAHTVKPAPATPESVAVAPANNVAQPQGERPEPAMPEITATAAPQLAESPRPDATVATPEPSPQQQQLADIRLLADQLSGSAEQLTTMAETNHRLKLRLQELSEEVAALRAQLEADRASQAQLLASLQRQDAEPPSGQVPADLLAQLGSPLTLIGAGVVSVLSLLLGIMLWLRKRNRSNEDQALAEPSFADHEETGPFDGLLTVDTDDEQVAQSSDEWKDGPAVSLVDSAADSDAAVDEALFSTAEAVDTGDKVEQTEGNPDPAALLDRFGSDPSPQSAIDEPRSSAGKEGQDADRSATRETMLAADNNQADAASDNKPGDADEDLSATRETMLAADGDPADAASDNKPGDADEDLSVAWEAMLAADGDPADAASDNKPGDADEDLSVAWEAMLAADGDPADAASDNPPADDDGDLSAALDKLLADDGDPADVARDTNRTEGDEAFSAAWDKLLADDGEQEDDVEQTPVETAQPASDPQSDGLDWPETLEVSDETSAADGRRRQAERDSASEAEKQLRQSLSLEADAAEDKESAPGTLEQQFIDKAAASEVDDLFAKGAFAEREAEASSDEGSDTGFIDIEKLLAESDDDDKALEPYDDIHLNVGLDGFPEIMPAVTGGVDVDADGEAAAKLDLARAYMEIDDRESARMLIGEVLEEGDDKLKLEAQKLLKRLK